MKKSVFIYLILFLFLYMPFVYAQNEQPAATVSPAPTINPTPVPTDPSVPEPAPTFAPAPPTIQIPDATPTPTETTVKRENAAATDADIKLPKSGSSLKHSVVENIFKKMQSVNKGLNDYSCPFTVNAKVKYAFLEVPFNLDGNYYFKAPDKHKVVFVKAPQFLSKYPQVFGWSLPDPKDYSFKIFDGEGEYSNCFVLRMIPVRGMGDMQKVEMWVDRNTWLFPRQRYSYNDGGYVDVVNKYRQQNGFNLFDTMSMDVSFPKANIKAGADVVYKDYVINAGIPDDIFNSSNSGN